MMDFVGGPRDAKTPQGPRETSDALHAIQQKSMGPGEGFLKGAVRRAHLLDSDIGFFLQYEVFSKG